MISCRHRGMAAQLALLLSCVLVTWAADKGTDLTPLETMADVTNDFGVCVLQIIASPSDNTVFSPYGLVSMALLVYEGSTGQTAAEIYNTLHLPWHRDIVRIGFRDLHRYLRSYFSSEGFLKGLVLSKPNVPLRPSYIEVMRFYGFQPDNTITQPVLTTQAAITNREKDSNETIATTFIPETTTVNPDSGTTLPSSTKPTGGTSAKPPNKKKTTTKRPGMTTRPMSTKPTKATNVKKPNKNNKTTAKPGSTTMTTSTTKKKTGVKKPNKMNMTIAEAEITTTPIVTTTSRTIRPYMTTMSTFFTTESSNIDTTTDIVTAMNSRPNQPDVLNMQGITTQGTTTLGPEETTIINGTTKNEIITTETTSAQNRTTLEMTTKISTRGTMNVDLTTKEMEITTNKINMPTDSESTSIEQSTLTSGDEDQTDSVTTDMDVMTLTNKIPPLPESMNMILDMKNSTEDTQTDVETVTDNILDTETSTSQNDTPISEPELVSNEVTTQEVYLGETLTDTMTLSTLYVDSAVPLADFVILTTPAEVELMTQKDQSMLEAFILMDNKEELNPIPVLNLVSSNEGTNKRSTQTFQPVTKPTSIEYTIPLDNLYTSLEEQGMNQIDDSVNLVNEDENYSHFNDGSSSTSDIDTSHVDLNHSVEAITEDFEYMINRQNLTDSLTEDSEEENSGLPTLEPDTIIFPTNKSPRLIRAIKSSERPAGLGNWVGSATGWRPTPTDQWFWTFRGDKLVPVLTYCAFIPWADLPSLGSTAIQLPLDDPRYTLMILLPKNARGLKQLLYSLQWYPIRDILKVFKPTPVYAVVPTFTIIKHINLTPALHKLGIRSMFEAYQANLSEMSSEPNLYIRTVEQLITISVQKYYTSHKWLDASPDQVNQYFMATHPFAYFVIDIETKVVLVAGTIVDPSLRSS